MEQRRREGMRLLGRGVSQAEVARRCEVSRPTAMRWEQQRKAVRGAAWKRRALGRRPKLSPSHRQQLEKALLQGAQAHGFLNDLWMLPLFLMFILALMAAAQRSWSITSKALLRIFLSLMAISSTDGNSARDIFPMHT